MVYIILTFLRGHFNDSYNPINRSKIAIVSTDIMIFYVHKVYLAFYLEEFQIQKAVYFSNISFFLNLPS